MTNCELHYHLVKANKVGHALSRKVVAFAIIVEKMLVQLQKVMCCLKMKVVVGKLLA